MLRIVKSQSRELLWFVFLSRDLNNILFFEWYSKHVSSIFCTINNVARLKVFHHRIFRAIPLARPLDYEFHESPQQRFSLIRFLTNDMETNGKPPTSLTRKLSPPYGKRCANGVLTIRRQWSSRGDATSLITLLDDSHGLRELQRLPSKEIVQVFIYFWKLWIHAHPSIKWLYPVCYYQILLCFFNMYS